MRAGRPRSPSPERRSARTSPEASFSAQSSSCPRLPPPLPVSAALPDCDKCFGFLLETAEFAAAAVCPVLEAPDSEGGVSVGPAGIHPVPVPRGLPSARRPAVPADLHAIPKEARFRDRVLAQRGRSSRPYALAVNPGRTPD